MVKANKDQIIALLRTFFASRPEIKAGYLFGSRASGRENNRSDIDIAILKDGAVDNASHPYGYPANVLTELFKLLRTDQVDLAILNSAPPLLRHRVLRFGKLIYCTDETARVRFQVKTMRDYCDSRRLRTWWTKKSSR